jgi:hypothetical protein
MLHKEQAVQECDASKDPQTIRRPAQKNNDNDHRAQNDVRLHLNSCFAKITILSPAN